MAIVSMSRLPAAQTQPLSHTPSPMRNQQSSADYYGLTKLIWFRSIRLIKGTFISFDIMMKQCTCNLNSVKL